jgi:hypothetical protein
MRNIALTFLGCFTILAACSNSDDAEKVSAIFLMFIIIVSFFFYLNTL